MIDKIKRDTELNWSKAINFIPKEDEVIIYDCDTRTRIKIGDGKTKVIDLPFAEEIIPSLKINNIDGEVVFIETAEEE